MSFITDRGLNTKSFQQIYEEIARKWHILTGKELRDNKPEGQFIKAISEHLSNKGFTEQDVDALWPSLEAVFYDAFVSTASNIALDYLSKLRLTQGRRPETHATGTAWVMGDANTEIAANDLVFVAPDKEITFVNTRAVRIRPLGIAYFPIRCTIAGPKGNIAAGALTVQNLPNGVSQASTTPHTTESITGVTQNNLVDLPSDLLESRYQLLEVEADVLKDIVLKVKNPGETNVFEIGITLYEHDTGHRIARAPTQRVILLANEVKEIVFSFEGLDLAEYTSFRVVPWLLGGSLQLVAASSGGLWHEDHIQTEKSLWTKTIYGAGGKTTGGSDTETSYELRRRFYESLYTPGWGNPETIRAKLMDIPGVMFVRIVTNPLLEEKTTDDYGNLLGFVLPPKSIAVVAWGGDPELIARVIYDRVPIGTELVGNTTVLVPAIQGQLVPIKFSRPLIKQVFARVAIVPTTLFPANGAQLVQDSLIAYIGGIDSSFVEHAGAPPGQRLAHGQAIKKIISDVPSVRDIELVWGFDGDTLVEDPLPIKFLEKPWITADNITVILRGR